MKDMKDMKGDIIDKYLDDISEGSSGSSEATRIALGLHRQFEDASDIDQKVKIMFKSNILIIGLLTNSKQLITKSKGRN